MVELEQTEGRLQTDVNNLRGAVVNTMYDRVTDRQRHLAQRSQLWQENELLKAERDQMEQDLVSTTQLLSQASTELQRANDMIAIQTDNVSRLTR